MDRNLGKHVIATALRDAGHRVEIHDDHLPIDSPDEDWIEFVSARGWVALTKDKNIRYRSAEINAIKMYGALVMVIRAKNASGAEIGESLVRHHHRLRRFAEQHPAPFIAEVDRAGKISRYAL